MIDIENAVKIALKTGNLQLGSKKAKNLAKKGEVQLIIVANNCPKHILEDLRVYCQSDIPIYQFKGTNWDLGFLCGKEFMVSALSVIDPGDSDILKVKEE